MLATIQIKAGTATAWSSANPVLDEGEPGWDKTNSILKIGDNATAWNSLPSVSTPLDADLVAIANLTPTNDDVLQRKAGAWTNRSIAQLKTDLALNNVTNNAQYYPDGTDVAITDGGTGVSTLPSGLLKGAGTSAITAATAGTDYVTPTGVETLSNKTLTNPKVGAILDGNGVTALTITATPSAVNGLVLRDAVAAGTVILETAGTSTDIPLNLKSKGTSTVQANGVEIVVISGSQTLAGKTLTSPTLITPALGTPSSGDLTSCTFPTLNQNTTGSAAKWTTARNLAGNSVDGSANVNFANKFIVQGTTDSGLSAAQFLGALGTGIVKNTTTTGVLSIAAAGTDYVAPNASITGATKTKVTYDAKGLVTAGADATTADIADSTNKRYVTDAQLTVLGNTSGTNTGNQTSIVGITGSVSEFNTALTGADFYTSGGTDVPVADGGTGVSTLTGIVKGNGASAFSAAAAGTDYVAPGGALGTPSSGTLTNVSGLPISGLVNSTSAALGLGTIELGHASDTTVSRLSAGVIGVEGIALRTINPRVNNMSFSATPTFDLSLYDLFTMTLTGAITSATFSNGVDGQSYRFRFKDNGTAKAIALGSSARAVGITIPNTTVASKLTYLVGTWNSTDSKMDFNGLAQEA